MTKHIFWVAAVCLSVLSGCVVPIPSSAPSVSIAPVAMATNSEQGRLVELMNQTRQKRGAGRMIMDKRLTALAQAHADDMQKRGYFSHRTPSGVGFAQRMKRGGFGAVPTAENLARGQSNAESALNSWMNSRPHRANLLSSRYTAVGIGLSSAGHWVAIFADM